MTTLWTAVCTNIPNVSSRPVAAMTRAVEIGYNISTVRRVVRVLLCHYLNQRKSRNAGLEKLPKLFTSRLYCYSNNNMRRKETKQVLRVITTALSYCRRDASTVSLPAHGMFANVSDTPVSAEVRICLPTFTRMHFGIFTTG